MQIGELSRRTAVKVPTIRYYEDIGLMPAVLRTEGNQRRYGEAEERRLRFIRHARDLGFDIEAIRELIALTSEPDRSCADVDRIARHHLVSIEQRISGLTLLRDELTRMIDSCSHGSVSDCRIIEVLRDHGQCGCDHPPLK